MSVAPRTAAFDPVADALVRLAARVPSSTVIDVGGGSGTRAVPLALLGCTVLVVDSSIDALAVLRRRAADAGVASRITAIQGDAVALTSAVPQGQADLVLCHHLLETVDDPVAAVAGIAGALKPGGLASVLVAGRFAAVLAQAVAGRFGDARAILTDPDGRFGADDPLRRRFDVAGLELLLESGGLLVESMTGVGVVSGLIPGGVRPAGGNRRHGVDQRSAPSVRSEGGRPGPATGLSTGSHIGVLPDSAPPVDEPRLAGLESVLARHQQLREIATDLHAVARLSTG